MEYQHIPNTDLNISVVALGTWVFGGDSWGGSKESDCLNAVLAAVECGINLIDTAPIYGYGFSEKIVGKAIKGKRDKVLLATKCGLIGKGGRISNNLKPESIRKEIEESLQRLGVEYIDIYQCHWPDPQTPIEKTLETMCQLKKEGKIRYIGVSNFDRKLLEEASSYTDIVTCQNQYSLLERSIEKEVLPFCKKKGMGLITYGSLAGGILTGKYQVQTQFKRFDAREFFYPYYKGEKFYQVRNFLNRLSKLGKPLTEIAINWIRQQEGVTSAIVGARHPQQVKENARSVSWRLTPEQWHEINSMSL